MDCLYIKKAVSQKERFLEPIEKKSMSLFTGEPVSANIALFR